MKRVLLLVLSVFALPLFAEDWPDGSWTLGAYALGELPVGAWSDTAKSVAGGGIRAEYGISPGKAGFCASAEGAIEFPASDSEISRDFDFSLLAGIWARLFKIGRFSGIPSLWAGALSHIAGGEKNGFFVDLEFKAEIDLAPFYIRAAENNGKVLHGPGIRAGIVYNFGDWKYEIVEVPATYQE